MLPEKCSPKNAPQNKMLPGKNAPRQNALHQNAPRKKMLPEKNAPQEKMLSIKMLPEKKCSPGKNALHQNAPRKTKMLPKKMLSWKKCFHMSYLSKTLFKYVRQAFYFLTLPWVIRDKTDLG